MLDINRAGEDGDTEMAIETKINAFQTRASGALQRALLEQKILREALTELKPSRSQTDGQPAKSSHQKTTEKASAKGGWLRDDISLNAIMDVHQAARPLYGPGDSARVVSLDDERGEYLSVTLET